MALIDLKNPKTMITGLLLIVVAMQILVSQLPSVITSIINLSQISNLGFSSFFASGGVVLLMLGVAVALAIFGMLGFGGKGKR
jgi:hypothetical protein